MAEGQWRDEQLIARTAGLLMLQVHELLQQLEIPDHLDAVDRFTSANVRRLLFIENNELWEKVVFKNRESVGKMEKSLIELVRLALSAGVTFNHYLAAIGQLPVNFIEEAARLDARIKFKEVASAKTDQVK